MFDRLRSSVFNLSHNVSGTANMGYVMPISIMDVVPGESIRHSVHALLRTQALIAPVMHTVDIDIDAYFVPDRIIWDDSEDFHSGGDDGLATPIYPTMEYPAEGYGVSSLADMLGLPVVTYDIDGNPIPVTNANADDHSALPFRAYAKIWNDYYRDTQLQDEVVIDTTSGPDTTTSRVLLRPCWKRDYFTKARPQPQLGPDVILPFSGNAPVGGVGVVKSEVTFPTPGTAAIGETGGVDASGGDWQRTGDVNAFVVQEDPDHPGYPGVYALLDEASGIPIIEQREANAVMRYLEHNNNWGGRYIEQVWSRFKTRVPDYRLDRPEFLGSGQAKFQFSEVLNTAGESEPVGSMAGHGISLVGSNKFKYRTPEHGWIIMVMVIRPKAQYMQGQHRMWNRRSKYDFLLPEFANIGDQSIQNRELYVNSAAPNDTLGFTPIFDEYRTIPSRVFGEFRTTQNYYTMARIFNSEPALNSTLVECVPTDRIFPVEITLANSLMMNISHKISARRPLPSTPNPRLM